MTVTISTISLPNQWPINVDSAFKDNLSSWLFLTGHDFKHHSNLGEAAVLRAGWAGDYRAWVNYDILKHYTSLDDA